MKKMLVLCFLLALYPHLPQAQTPINNFPITNGKVYTLLRNGSRVYVGGDFTFIGPNRPYGCAVSTATGDPDYAMAVPNGTVYATVADGSGGWYIAGAFTKVGTQSRAGLARINADGSVNAFNPGVSGGDTKTLLLSGGTLYLGGSFTQVAGQARNRLASVDAATGALSAWDPSPNNTVHALAANAGSIYVGGEFTTIAGQPRNGLVSFDASTGSLTAWTVRIDGRNGITCSVNAIAINGSTVYIGGRFDQCNLQTRTSLASVDIATGATGSWYPYLDDYAYTAVNALIATNGNVYIGGVFAQINGYGRISLGAVDGVTGATVTNFNPNLYPTFISAGIGIINTLALDGTTLYAGGYFTNLGGSSGPEYANLAAFSVTGGYFLLWTSNTSDPVQALAVGGGKLYAGGSFVSIGGYPRWGLAAVDATSNKALYWKPQYNYSGYGTRAIAVSGNTVYAGGTFTGPVKYVVAYNASSGFVVSSFNAGANMQGSSPYVQSLAVDGSRLLIGGSFLYQQGSLVRSNLMAVDGASGALTGWDPGDVNGVVKQITTQNGLAYIAGDFITAGGQVRGHLAALDLTTGQANSWNPNANGSVNTFSIVNSTVYAGGAFGSLGGQVRGNLGAVDLNTGVATPWKANTDLAINSLSVYGNHVTVGGDFRQIGGATGPMRNYAAIVDLSGNITSWNPNPSASVRAVLDDGAKIVMGGDFTMINTELRNSLAAFATPSDAPLPVRLLSFTARLEGSGPASVVRCNWATASEQNSRSFVVERSTDGRNYTGIGTVAAAGNSSGLRSYDLTDLSPAAGVSFYRLKEIDIDSNYTYSKIAIITIGTDGGVLIVYPNPVRDIATVTVSVARKERANYTVVDARGAAVLRGTIQLESGSNTSSISLASLPAGSYTLMIQGSFKTMQAALMKK